MASNGDKKAVAAKDAKATAAGATQIEACDLLCSLGECASLDEACAEDSETCEKKGKKGKGCAKQHQLPMFLSKTYHMIDRCDPEIATWSDTGDNFVVKNVEKFSSSVLPQYFKHSNFSSFARQLNFYGFRKLKAEPILTADYDARTACYVRFYHEKFQKDKPELLKDIKRATKSDMQSRDDLESLKSDIAKLNEKVSNITNDYDRKLAEMSYEYNRRITALHAEYDRLAMVVQQLMAKNGDTLIMPPVAPTFAPMGMGSDMMSSLTHAASIAGSAPVAEGAGAKRPATEAPADAPAATRARAV
jgi:hypothetical protein